MEEKELDVLIIHSPKNRRYMTGFTGTAGIALISQTEQYFITDFRYVKQAEDQAKDFEVIEHKEAIERKVASLIKEMNAKSVGFENDHLTYSEYERFNELISCELIPAGPMVEKLRMIKTEEELQILKESAKIADAAFEHILSFIKPGVREIDIATELEFFMRKQGATSSSFDIIVASGNRSALPHGVASSKTISEGEFVTMDFGAVYKGYCSDLTRTVAVGSVSDSLREIYDIVLEAQMLALEKIKPKMNGKEADAIARDFILEKGYGNHFGHGLGHGIGLDIHEEPRLSPRSDMILKEGMVVTVEPGIYLPEVGGCRIEDDIVITSSGNKRLTTATKEFIQL